MYGGNNIGGKTENANVTINGGTIPSRIYGGGNEVDTTTTTLNLISSDNTLFKVFGGGNHAGVETSNVYCESANVEELYGGSNFLGTVNQSNLTVNGGNVIDAYGGGNQAETTTTNITILGTISGNAYGGGNQAAVKNSNITVKGKILGETFGGGNQANVENDTNVILLNANLVGNAYGGGNEETVTGNTNVRVTDTISSASIYAGGNGASAIVYGNVNINLDGTLNDISKSIFGGGNKAPTGTEDKNTSKSTVNIAGGKIGGNVYGGPNTSVINGTTQVNIGYDAVSNSDLEKGNIIIKGTVFGGGEANEAGDEKYDFDHISVTKGINILIDGNGHNELSISGSIFGSGNASSTSRASYITIKNYGTFDKPKSNISLQRANCATIINSAFSFSGTTDRTNDYADDYFTISRIDRVKLANNSTLFLANGANLLMNFDSLLIENGNEIKATVNIDKT